VPPRDLDTAGPIATFLQALGGNPAATPPFPPATPPSVEPIRAPFDIEARYLDPTGAQQVLRTQVGNPPSVGLAPNPGDSIQFGVVVDGAWRLLEGTLVDEGNNTLDTLSEPFDDALRWSAVISPTAPRTFTLQNWRAFTIVPIFDQAQRTGASVTITARIMTQNNRIPELWLEATGEVGEQGVNLSDRPCLDEACAVPPRRGNDNPRASSAMPLFPVIPPWMHEDPRHRGGAADPRVLALAILYGWLTSELVAHRAGTETDEWTSRRFLANGLYQVAWAWFFNVDGTEREARGRDLQRLLTDWCRTLMYPGPRCNGEPHGVVLGCALVAGGDFQEINPWDGRRWVMHYPLLAHWGQQFGMTPPDVTASKIFSMLCCLGNLAAPGESEMTPFSVNDSWLLVAREWGRVIERMQAAGILPPPAVTQPPVREERLEFLEFAGRVIDAFSGSVSGAPRPGFVVYTLESSPSFRLVRPD
jgi:hypothetical protein